MKREIQEISYNRFLKFDKFFKGETRLAKKVFPFFMLYLACVSSAEISSRDLITFLSRSQFFGYISQAFRKIDTLINKWGYEQIAACKSAIQQCKEPKFKGFLLRFSQAISINAPMQEFARVEYERFIFTYEEEYNRTMDKLKSLSDAYSSILTSTAFISVSMLLAAITFGAGSIDILLIGTIVSVLSSLISFIFLIYSSAPPEEIPNSLRGRPLVLKRLSSLFKPSTIAAFVIILFSTLMYFFGLLKVPSSMGIWKFLIPLPLSFMIAGILLVFLGWKGSKVINNIKALEYNFPLFIKTLGKAAAITGSLSIGISRIIYNEYGKLNPLIKRVYHRLKLGIGMDYSLRVMEAESGSELIKHITEVFYESLSRGGKFSDVAYLCFNFANSWLARRKRREQIFGYLKGLLIPLQITTVATLTLTQGIANLLIEFGKMIGEKVINIANISPELITLFFFGISISLTLGNTLSLWLIKGDSKFTFQFYLGFFLLINGVIIFAVGMVTESLLGGFVLLKRINLG
ncbi:MAG: hypothetical protein QXX95_03690 [Nitrososphaerales archaeon]